MRRPTAILAAALLLTALTAPAQETAPPARAQARGPAEIRMGTPPQLRQIGPAEARAAARRTARQQRAPEPAREPAWNPEPDPEPPPPPRATKRPVEPPEPPPAPKPTPTPNFEPSPQPAPPGVEQWRSLVAAYWPAGDVETALRIMACESGGDPNATNGSSGAAGLFQHIPRYWPERATNAGWPGASPYDPAANIAVSAYLWAGGAGASHWRASAGCW